MAKETIIIDGVRYYADRPRSCRGCFFWKNRKVGCTLPLVQAAVTVLVSVSV